MPTGPDFAVWQWLRDAEGYPLLDEDKALADTRANELFRINFEMGDGLLSNPINFDLMNAKSDFAGIRAIDNAGNVDKSLSLNWAGVKKPKFAYCNWKVGADPIALAEKFYATMLPLGLGELPPAIDYEPKTPAPVSDLYKFCAKVNELFNHPSGISFYSNWYFMNQLGNPPSWINEPWINKWVASWTTASSPTMPPGWLSWLFWQYTNKGNGAEYGVLSAQIDLNRFAYDNLANYLRPATGRTIEERLKALEDYALLNGIEHSQMVYDTDLLEQRVTKLETSWWHRFFH